MSEENPDGQNNKMDYSSLYYLNDDNPELKKGRVAHTRNCGKENAAVGARGGLQNPNEIVGKGGGDHPPPLNKCGRRPL